MAILLNKSEVEGILPPGDMPKAIELVEEVFSEHGKGRVQMPPKLYLTFREFSGDLRVMPSYVPKLQMAGTKIVNVHPKNPEKGLSTVMALIILNDPKTGIPIAVMDGTHITRMRTGAVAGLATKYLARKDSRTFGVVGAGGQSPFQILGVNAVKKVYEIKVNDTKKEAVEGLKKRMAELGISIISVDLRKTCSSDILTTITPAIEPVVRSEYIREGTHINAMGADAEGKEEIEPAVLQRARIFVDDWGQASHSGEINVPLRKGIITRGDIAGTLGQVVVGLEKGRRSADEITVFDSTGLSIQDLALANHVYAIAKKKGLGSEFPIFS
jgi:alanine dehydrogenase